MDLRPHERHPAGDGQPRCSDRATDCRRQRRLADARSRRPARDRSSAGLRASRRRLGRQRFRTADAPRGGWTRRRLALLHALRLRGRAAFARRHRPPLVSHRTSGANSADVLLRARRADRPQRAVRRSPGPRGALHAARGRVRAIAVGVLLAGVDGHRRVAVLPRPSARADAAAFASPAGVPRLSSARARPAVRPSRPPLGVHSRGAPCPT
jgi:hypothetical protein